MSDKFFRGARVKAPPPPPEEKVTFSEALFVTTSIAILDEHASREQFLELCGVAFDAVTASIKRGEHV